MKCIVYNLEDPQNNSFFVGCNGISVTEQCGIEIDLKKEFIEVLENAIIEKPAVDSVTKQLILDPETGKCKIQKVSRFKVVKLEKEDEDKKGEEDKTEERPFKKIGRPRKE